MSQPLDDRAMQAMYPQESEERRPAREDMREVIDSLGKEIELLETKLTPVLRNRGMVEHEISVLSEVGQSSFRDWVSELHGLRLRLGRINDQVDV